MSFFSKLLSSKKNTRFVSERSFKSNLTKQLNMSLQTLTQLKQSGITDSSELKLEFFFYTDNENKAISLVNTLKDKKCLVEFSVSAENAKIFIITGWTSPIKIDKDSISNWTKTMAKLGVATP
ncbi:hypothetical protein GF357_01120 [Candidatus Dojkabacteria bacterium]|nr:hypothetical protein [Candidatus Dojkabacteria bacterium]